MNRSIADQTSWLNDGTASQPCNAYPNHPPPEMERTDRGTDKETVPAVRQLDPTIAVAEEWCLSARGLIVLESAALVP